MTHFFKSVRGHGDPRQHYLRNMLHNLAQARAAIIFMGDSTLRVSNLIKYSSLFSSFMLFYYLGVFECNDV